MTLEAPEIAGYLDQWRAAPAALAARLGIDHAELAGVHCTAVAALPGVRVLNHALGLPAAGRLDDEVLGAVERFYAERGVPALLALRDGADAEAQLAERGYERGYAWVKFARDALLPPARVSCDLEVRPVGDRDARGMGEIVASSFDLPEELAEWLAALVGRPGWHCLGAYDGDELVATGSLYAHGDSGWVTFGATAPAHRGRRAQKALLAARVELGRRLGLAQLVTETGEPEAGRPDASYRNILGAGFRPAYSRPFWSSSA
jgi:hypothetical protein